MKTTLILILAIASLAGIASAQAQAVTFTPGVTFADGAMTALVTGPSLPCPPAFNWPWCSALNTGQTLWFYASTTDPTVIEFTIQATYTPVDGGADVTVSGKAAFPANPAPGQAAGLALGVLTLPYPAKVKSATISPVGITQTSNVAFGSSSGATQ